MSRRRRADGQRGVAQLQGQGAFATQTAGVLSLAGGALAITTAVLPPPAQGSESLIIACGAVAALAGVAMLIGRPRLGTIPMMLFGLGGTALISVATYQGGPEGGTADNGMLYLWVCLFSFYFFPLRLAMVQLAVIAAAFGWLVWSQTPADEALTRWLVVVTTLLVAGLVISRLRDSVYELVRELSRHARHDSLTGLLNRRALDERAELERSRMRRDGTLVSVLVVDIDDFKALNDAEGHAVGDEALKRVAAALRTRARRVDAVARLGGDEFGAILPGATVEAARAVAESIRARCDVAPPDGGPRITVSGGVAMAGAEDPDFEAAWRAADAAMYEAKRAGGDQVRVATAETPARETGETAPPKIDSCPEPAESPSFTYAGSGSASITPGSSSSS